MAAFEQMANGQGRSAPVVGDHAVGVEMTGPAVDEDERGSGASLLIQIAVIVARGHDDDPVDAPLAEGADQLALAIRILVAAAGEHEHATLAGGVLDATMQRRRERVRDVLEDELDRLRLAAEA